MSIDIFRSFFTSFYWKQRASETILDVFTPLEYLAALDNQTRLAIVCALLVTSYVIFASVMRFGRIIVSVLMFTFQIVLVGIVILIAAKHKDVFGQPVKTLLERLEL